MLPRYKPTWASTRHTSQITPA